PHGHRKFGNPKPDMPASFEQWMSQAPKLETDNDVLRHTYRQSMIDLAALRFRPLKSLSYSLPAAGLPWFMALFGRDSLITAYQALPFQPHLARTTLEALTAWQAKERDDFRDAEPVKIVSGLRLGELTMLGERPHSPYYGTHDATPLFLILLDEYERWAGDRDFVRSLQPAAMKALDWMERYGDRDGDGYLEYQTRAKEGLANQCWKDSWNSILFKDGTVPKGPIATCEIQGYAYDARVRTARLAREVWFDPQLAGRLEGDAATLREGMRRYGHREAASHLALMLIQAADAFEYRLPEVFAGFPRSETGAPVEYPTASRPQAWAAGAPLLALRTALGLDVVDGTLRVDPHLSEGWG